MKSVLSILFSTPLALARTNTPTNTNTDTAANTTSDKKAKAFFINYKINLMLNYELNKGEL